MATFTTEVYSGDGRNAGIRIPDEVVEELGGKRVPVTVTLRGRTYQSTTAVMGGFNLVSLAKEHRDAAGVGIGDEVEVTIVRDDAPREVEVPAEVAADPALRAAWDALAPSRRKEHARQLVEAKTDATRARRLEKLLAALTSSAG